MTALYFVCQGLLEQLYFIYGMEKHGLDSCSSGQGHMASSCEYGDWLFGWLVGWLVCQLVVCKVFDYKCQSPLKCDAMYLEGLFIWPEDVGSRCV